MYGEVVPNTKTDLKSQTFTYEIPKEFQKELKVGSLVLIPFGKRKIEGIITKILNFKLQIPKEKLKPILKILWSEPLISHFQLKLSKWMASYYFAPLSDCLFEMVSLPPRKKKITKPYLITKIGNLQKELFPKFEPYLKLSKRALTSKKQIIILFPEIILAKQAFLYFLKKLKKAKIAFYHGELNKTERFSLYEKIKNGQIDIVIGSQKALFSPLPRLGLIILDEEESENYKNERSPRFNVKTLAEKICQINKAKLVLSSPTPSVESYYLSRKRKFYLIRPKPLLKPLAQNLVIDMRKEIQKRNYSPFSEILKSFLKRTLSQRRQAILFVPRRGAATYIFCRDCGFVLSCPECELPLVYHSERNLLICHHCQYKEEPKTFCPNCQGIYLRYQGVGTQTVEMEVKKLFLKPDILRIDKDMPSEWLRNNQPEIIIGTQKLLSNWFSPVSLLAVISLDPLLNLPDFRQGERIFSLIFKLKSLALDHFLLQTFYPFNSLIQTALKGDYSAFYEREILERKKFGYPPFSQLIRLLCENKNEEKAKREAKILADKLKSEVEILGPSPCFYHKLRGKYRWQIIIRVKNQKSKIKNLTNLLKTLPSDWTIDVDPETLF